MKKIGCLILLFYVLHPIYAGKVLPLSELLKPQNLSIGSEDLYVRKGVMIYHYSLRDYKLKKKFGKEGEGPGEFEVYPGQSVQVIAKPNFILVSSIGKIVFFTRQGDYIKEKKTASILGTPFLPLKDKFVGTGFAREENKTYITINIFAADLKKEKELSRYKFRQGQGFIFFERSFYFQVYENLIYLSWGKDFIIDIFDTHGQKQHCFQHEIQPKKITSANIKEVFDWYRSNPASKAFYDIIKQQAKFPSNFTCIRNFFISDLNLFVQTYSRNNQDTEFIILDLNGKIQKKVYLPIIKSNPAEQNQLFTICNGRLYQIVENEEEESWELHILDIRYSFQVLSKNFNLYSFS